ncbi:MAG: GYDIA family GHMP kinase [Bacteroidales bacterium]|jgi:mevalonate kinase|nr:GYDIA family GHMP kinase [Bacteroidales bacterium]
MDQKFYASGKILLTAEFMILHGAKALAIPLKVGQSLELYRKKELGLLHWVAKYKAETWFECKIQLDTFEVQYTSDEAKSTHLVYMLKKLVEIHPPFTEKLHAADVITTLDFDPHYGFGSSSTLTSLLAQWAKVDSMQYHFHISKGSGYDVACADAKSSLLYEMIDEMPVTQSVDFQPPFSEKLWLIYLGQKQNTSESVTSFLNTYSPKQDDIDYFSALSYKFLTANTLNEFGKLIEEHEERLSELLKLPSIKEQRFSDLNGYIKSLGAWGGVFALLATDWDN